MTLREQAREAAGNYATRGSLAPEEYADAASDVWEPIVRECLEFIIRSADQIISYDEHYDLVEKLQEALGDGISD